MKKLILAALCLFLLTGLALAEDEYYVEKDSYKLPPLNGSWTYTVEDSSILRQSSGGKFKGIKTGVTVINAVSGSETLSFRAEVVPKITAITLSRKEITLLMGESFLPDISVKPASSTAKILTFESSDENVAYIGENGTVIAAGPGKCKIKISSAEKTAYLAVTVNLPVEGVSFPAETIRVPVGKTEKLKLVFTPEGAGESNIDWQSSDPSVATVMGGSVTAKAPGEAVITATLPSGLTAECTVRAVIPVQSITIKKTVIKVSGTESVPLTWTISPKNATETDFTFESTDPSIAVVDENGVVTGVSKGSCRVIITSLSGKKAAAEVRVSWTPVKGINNFSLHAAPRVGEQYTVRAVTEPENASDNVIFYESSDPAIASVDENGVVTAYKPGSVIITMTAKEGGFFTEFPLTVRPADEKRLDGVVIGINPGHQIKKNLKEYPIAPGSKTMGTLNSGFAVGVKTKTPEYELTLAVSLKLRDLLEEAGATVIMTRTENDVELTNIDRADMLNAANVDLAIQVHANSNKKESAHGLSTYSRSKGEWQWASAVASRLIHDALLDSTGAADAGVILYDAYMSLNYSTIPAILVEMGFMTNPEEDLLMETDEYRMKLAEGMYNGICEFMGR